MNVERINALADLIETLPHVGILEKEGFNMANYQHPCGTPACIAGFAIATYGTGDHFFSNDPSALAADLLNIEMYVACDLFHVYSSNKVMSQITPSEAAATLRHLATTGEVDWSIT